jgi:hypothetical protein
VVGERRKKQQLSLACSPLVTRVTELEMPPIGILVMDVSGRRQLAEGWSIGEHELETIRAHQTGLAIERQRCQIC